MSFWLDKCNNLHIKLDTVIDGGSIRLHAGGVIEHLLVESQAKCFIKARQGKSFNDVFSGKPLQLFMCRASARIATSPTHLTGWSRLAGRVKQKFNCLQLRSSRFQLSGNYLHQM